MRAPSIIGPMQMETEMEIFLGDTRIAAMKARAKALRAAWSADGEAISHSEALEAVALQEGHRDWNTAVAVTKGRRVLKPGARVEGRYLSQPFTGRVHRVEVAGRRDIRLVLAFDRPVNVSKFTSFDVLRRRVTATLGTMGQSHTATSDGVPHMVLTDVRPAP